MIFLPHSPKKKKHSTLSKHSFRPLLLSAILVSLPLSSYAGDPKKTSLNEGIKTELILTGIAGFYYAVKHLALSTELAARNLINTLWEGSSPAEETPTTTQVSEENQATAQVSEENQATAQDQTGREEAVVWMTQYMNHLSIDGPFAQGMTMPAGLSERLGGVNERSDSTDGAAEHISQQEVIDNALNQRFDAFELANTINQSNPYYRTPLQQLADRILNHSPAEPTDQTDAGRAERPDNEMRLRTNPTDNIELSQLTAEPRRTLRAILNNPNLYTTQNTLIALHAFLRDQYLNLRTSYSHPLSERQIAAYRRSISHLVMAIEVIGQYNQAVTYSQTSQHEHSSWNTNEYVKEVFTNVSQSIMQPEAAFDANILDNVLRLTFGIIQHFRSFIIARGGSEYATSQQPESQDISENGTITVDTVIQLDSLSNHLVPDSDTHLSSVAYARNNVQPHTNAILSRGYWINTSALANGGLNNFQIWHILTEMDVALQLVVLGQNELALSVIRNIVSLYKPLQERETDLPSGGDTAYQNIIQWVFTTVTTILHSESEEERQVYGYLKDRFFISVYALVVYTENPTHRNGLSDHQISRINIDVLTYLYNTLLPDQSNTENVHESEQIMSPYLNEQYSQFLWDRHERHKATLVGNIIPSAKTRLSKKKLH